MTLPPFPVWRGRPLALAAYRLTATKVSPAAGLPDPTILFYSQASAVPTSRPDPGGTSPAAIGEKEGAGCRAPEGAGRRTGRPAGPDPDPSRGPWNGPAYRGGRRPGRGCRPGRRPGRP